ATSDRPDAGGWCTGSQIVDAGAQEPGDDGADRRGHDDEHESPGKQPWVRPIVGCEASQGGRGWRRSCHLSVIYPTELSSCITGASMFHHELLHTLTEDLG